MIYMLHMSVYSICTQFGRVGRRQIFRTNLIEIHIHYNNWICYAHSRTHTHNTKHAWIAWLHTSYDIMKYEKRTKEKERKILNFGGFHYVSNENIWINNPFTFHCLSQDWEIFKKETRSLSSSSSSTSSRSKKKRIIIKRTASEHWTHWTHARTYTGICILYFRYYT